MNKQVVLQGLGLTQRFHEGPLDVTVLKGLDLTVRMSETVAVVAPAVRAKAPCCTCSAGWSNPAPAACS